MADDDSFIQAWGRLEKGDELGAQAVFDRFAKRLIALARQRLAPRLQAKVDPEDVVQSAFFGFFRGRAAGQFEVENWESLWGLLVLIVARKCAEKADYYFAARRDARKDVAPRGEHASSFWQAVSEEPNPSHVLMLKEAIEQIESRLDDRDRRIFALGLEGYTTAEIAEQVGCSERTARRTVRRIGGWMDEMQSNGPSSVMELRPGSAPVVLPEASTLENVKPLPSGPAVCFEVFSGPHSGRKFEFDRKEVLLAGRDATAQIRLNEDPHFSRHHFRREVHPPECTLIDLESRNGTFVNGQRVQRATLHPGDIISGGKTRIRFSISGDPYQSIRTS